MSATLHPQDPAPAAIAPHLLHSPVNSPAVDIQHLMDAYHEPVPDSPNSLGFPSPPTSGLSVKAPHIDAQSTVPDSVTSPSGMLTVHSYGPTAAPPESALTAQVDFNNYSGGNVRLRIVFGDLALPTSVSPNGSLQERTLGQERGDWKLRTVVPPVGHASTHMAVGAYGRLEWPLTLQALDESGNILDSIGFGLFAYELPKQSTSSTSYEYNKPRPKSPPNKRLREDDDNYSPTTPTKRLALDVDTMQLRRMSVDDSYVDSQQNSSAHRPHIEGPALPQKIHIGMMIYPEMLKHPFLPHSQTHLPFQNQVNSQHLPDVATVPSSPGAHSGDSPALVRTSQLGHDAKPEQASVTIQGDLESMKHGWVENEFNANRRLVQFWKRQIGTTLHISFDAISQNDYKENTIVVSCIYRKNVQDFFVTSVDVIYLLEALAGNRFEVEEKNRIRRNLEGFKPMTVSKNKIGTEDFFRVIMELPPPRPRNIEKDVKVFEWGKLKMMLEKVFSKYSTVSVSPSVPSVHYNGSPHGSSSHVINPYPKGSHETSVESSHLLMPPVGLRPRPQRRCSPVAGARLRDALTLPPLHSSIQNQNAYPAYSDHFQPARYNGYDEGAPPGMYPYTGRNSFDPPLDFDHTLLKANTMFTNGYAGPPAVTAKLHDGFRSTSPLSCDNSPLSMTLSVSSGTSSDGGHVENHDLAALPVVVGSESSHRRHRHL